MSQFEQNLKGLASSEHVVTLRVFDSQGQLASVIPNVPGMQGALKVLNHVAKANGEMSFEQVKEAIQLFGEHVAAAQTEPHKHPNLALLLSLSSHDSLKVQRVTSSIPLLLERIVVRQGSAQDTEAFIDLLNQGALRAAEKVKGVWHPQTYVIDGILNYFATHENQRLLGGFWDKIPLKTANYTDQDFIESGVRYAPGAMVRTGAYIGPKTVVMNQAFVNIGAYIAGEGVMIDGASRVASCAQIGKGVKFGAGSGIEGVLEPAGRLPSIIEDHVKVGAMCEVAGIVQEGAVLASGVVMASGKKIFDEATGELVPPLACVVKERTFWLPMIPAYRLAVGGSLLSENGKFATDAIILKPGDLRDSNTLKHFEKQGILYQ